MCRIEDYIKKELIHCKVPVKTKETLFRYLSATIEKVSGVSADIVLNALKERESFGTTGIGSGVAIPHGRIQGCKDVIVHILTLNSKIPYGSIDGEDVELVFMLIVPDGMNLLYLKLLSQISLICNDRNLRENLIRARNSEEVMNIVKGVS